MPETLALHRLLFALLFAVSTATAGVARPPLLGAIAADRIVLSQSYSSDVVTITEPDRLKILAEEVASLDGRRWERTSIVKHGACGHRLLFSLANTTFLSMYVYPDKIYVAPNGTTRNPQFVAQLAQTDVPVLRRLLTSLPPSTPCQK